MSAFTLIISFVLFDSVHLVLCWCQLYLYSETGLTGTQYGPYDVGCIHFDGRFPNDVIDSATLTSNSGYSCTALFGASCDCGTGQLTQLTTVNPHSTTQITSFTFGNNVLSCVMLSVNTPRPTTGSPTTSQPSYNPSYNPTTEPTSEPTKYPITSNPTTYPTTDPTIEPTITLSPTKIPTFKDGQSAENIVSTQYIYTTKNSSFIINVRNKFELEYVIIIVILVLVILLIGFMVIIYRKKKRIIVKNVTNMDVNCESNTNISSVVMTQITNKNDKDIEGMYAKNETLNVTKDENVTDEKESNDELYETDEITDNGLYGNFESGTQCEDNDDLYETKTTTENTTGGKDTETEDITLH